MKKLTQLAMCLVVTAAMAGSASAVTVNIQFGYVYEDLGATDTLDQNMTCLLIADVNGLGWADYTAVDKDSFLADPTDVVLACFPLNAALAGAGTHTDTVNWDNTTKGVSEGDQFQLFWFNTPWSAGIETVGPGAAGIEYGYYRTDDVKQTPLGNSDFAYEVPKNSDAGFIYTFTTNTTVGDVSDADMAAKYLTVPEPTTAVLLVAGGLLAICRRRMRLA
jgi:hypothetical protein